MSDYILHNGELMHYGVLGMKWGVRRANRKLRKAGKIMKTDRVTTGPEYEKVRANIQKEYDGIREKYNKKRRALAEQGKLTSDARWNLIEAEADEANALPEKYAKDLDRAVLKDIGYKDVEKGMTYLAKKGIHLTPHYL